ncbi:MAG: prepilin-type N-terminal cleavage/methylation domain-containing protein, partial [Bacteroidetes bacterium]|nr:prepilin-type N-terminal cleavage/methylation domain-containing protein [Bacteroidota bacterium]
MKRLQGFSILELMLVLGLFSLLLSSFFIASQNNISYSTYRDSIFDLQSFLSKQYSQVLNPKG